MNDNKNDYSTLNIGDQNTVINNINQTGTFKEGDKYAVICPQCEQWTGRYNTVCGHPLKNCQYKVEEKFDQLEKQVLQKKADEDRKQTNKLALVIAFSGLSISTIALVFNSIVFMMVGVFIGWFGFSAIQSKQG
jgi:hypothetical protein